MNSEKLLDAMVSYMMRLVLGMVIAFESGDD
jgi:hypothetical protein